MSTDLLSLADDLLDLVLSRDPFSASEEGLHEYDARVPDLSHGAEEAALAALTALRARAAAIDPSALTAADRITLAAALNTIDAQVIEVETASVDHTVGTGWVHGPALLLAVAARARVSSAEQAADLLTRWSAFPGYLDTCADRLRTGAAAGRLPVASLVESAVRQVDGYLEDTGTDVFADVPPPADWPGGQEWSQQLRAVVVEQLRPAIRRWRDAVVSLPTRDDAHCGLVHLPGGAQDYQRLIALHTTLPLTAQEVHDLGRRLVDELVAQAAALGAELGLPDYPAVRDAEKASGEGVDPEQAMALSREAIARAEQACTAVFPAPMPPACAVEAMSPHLARSGMAPHYTAPVDDGRLGTYWFNAEDASAGAGWDLEVTAFHEAVPGHHLQVARTLLDTAIPRLQRYTWVGAHGEGWALYAELLAGELGLYSSTEARIGAIAMSLFRAARLVVDTGVHALGWSRAEAQRYFADTVPVAQSVVVAEVDRYIAWPGQALSYMVGQRELLRLRALARERLGERFDLAGFHGAVLDHGQLPLPAVGIAVDGWVESALATDVP